MPKTALAHLEDMLAGNARFAAGSAAIARAELALGQAPFAVVLGCSDSRVPVETVFDRVPGEIFVARVIGGVVSDETLASVEFAVGVLNTPLVIVLGHTNCGAVKAAVDYVSDGITMPGHIGAAVSSIVAAARATRDGEGDWWLRAVRENVRRNAAALEQRSSIVATAVRERRALVKGLVYDLHTGKVTLEP